MDNQFELELDLRELFHYLRRKLALILAITALCGILGFGVSRVFMTPMYTASTRMYVISRTYDTTVVSSDFQVANFMLSDYQVLITGRNVTKKVIENLDLPMKPEQLSQMVTVTAPDDTRVLQVNVTHANPQLAAKIANNVREVATEQLKEIMQLDAVRLVYEADVPQAPSSPNVSRNTLLAAAVGGFLCAGILVVLFVLDDSIRTEEDVERYLGISTLGIIPVTTELNVGAADAAARKGGKPAPKFKR